MLNTTDIENSTDDTYDEYNGTSEELVQDILTFIVKEKQNNSDLTLMDLVYSFCVKKNYNPVMVGEAIADDYYFKTLIANEMTACENSEEEW